MAVQDLVGIMPWTFVATIANLFIQIYLIKRFLFKPVNAIVEKRKGLADLQIMEAKSANAEAQAIKSKYEANISEARDKENELLVSAQKTAAMQSEEMLREAYSQVSAIKAKAENDIVQEKRKLMQEIKAEVGGIAMEIAEKVLEREIREKDHARLIDEFLAANLL